MLSPSRRRTLGVLLTGAMLGTATLLGATPADAFVPPSFLRASESPADASANGESNVLAMSPDGPFVLFSSDATNVIAPDVNGNSDIFLWNRATDVTERISVNSAEVQPAAGSCFDGDMSDDATMIAFTCWFSPIVPGPAGDFRQIFVRNRTTGTTTLMSQPTGTSGTKGNANSWNPRISGDGTVVTFDTDATNLLGAGADINGVRDVVARVLATNTNERVSVTSGEAPVAESSGLSSPSRSGRYIAFLSESPGMAPGDNNGSGDDVFVRDRVAGTTERVSVSSSEVGSASTTTGLPDISADGRFVAFTTAANNLDPRANNGWANVYLRDRTGGTTSLISDPYSAVKQNGDSEHPSVSADGRWVAFRSAATTLIPGDGATIDIFLRDRNRNVTTRISQTPAGAAANDTSREPQVSNDGQSIAFSSDATNLVAGPEAHQQAVTWSSNRYQLFDDVGPTHVFWDEIHWGVDNDIVDGYSDGTFRPTAPVSRQAMVAFLYRISNSPLGPFPATGFTDVPANSPFRIPIEWAVSQGITNGYGDNTFRPTDSVTRQAAVTFLYRIADPIGPFPDSGFPDVPADSAFGIPIDWAASVGIISGYSDGTFRPTVPMSRQAAVSFLYKATSPT